MAILRGVLGGVRRSSWERLEMGDSEVAGVVALSTASPARIKGQKERNDKHARTHAHTRAHIGRVLLTVGLVLEEAAAAALGGLGLPQQLAAQHQLVGRHRLWEHRQRLGLGVVSLLRGRYRASAV